MVDFHNPAIIKKDFLAVLQLWRVLDGIFIWEFLTTLDYEWRVLRGHRPYRWTIWIYSLTRVCVLTAIILNMIGSGLSTPLNCQVLWVIFDLILASLALGGASFLIVLRIIAIWKWNRIAVAIVICAWISGIAFFIHYITLIHARWARVPTPNVCEVPSLETPKITIIGLLVVEVVLLLTMLIGLLRLRVHGTMFALGQFLWKQGLIWLFLATVSEVPAAVFACLNLNEPFNLMFQTPALIMLTIGATRMHRSLVNFASSDCRTFDARPTGKVSAIMFAAPIPHSQVEAAFHVSSESADYPPANIGSGAGCEPQDEHFVLDIVVKDLENGG